MTRAILACLGVLALAAHAPAATLEVPTNGGEASGIGYFSGWKCPPNDNITLVIDGGAAIPAATNIRRGDTASICGNDGRNGYITQFNFNMLGNGNHAVSVRQNGQVFAGGVFRVTTFGTNFMTGASGSYTLSNFPQSGRNAIIEWSQGAQNFIITGTSGSPSPTPTQKPGPTPKPTATPTAQPTPTPAAGGLAALIGTWKFDYTLSFITFTETYRLQRLQIEDGVTYLVGLDDTGSLVTSGRVQDISPGSVVPFTYALLDPSIILCRFFVFDRTGNTSLSGQYFQFDLVSGNCVAPNGPYSMTGTRLSQSASEPMRAQRSAESLELGDVLQVEAGTLSSQTGSEEDLSAAVDLANRLRSIGLETFR